MKALCVSLAMLTATAFSADTRVFEMRTYYSPPGKLDALHARFRDHTCKLFEKHGITNIGYWVPIENTDNKLVYVVAFPDRAARDTSFKAFGGDPAWKQAQSESEKDGKIVAKVESVFLTALDFSPEIKPGVSTDGRVFELRTYTTPPGKLENLHARFRDHTLALFKKHGMTNLFYWNVMPEQGKSTGLTGTPDTTLIYLLAHQSPDAAKASFTAFRADPDWVAARKASEEKAGGSLTIEKDGVKSLFLKATDYSPTR